ncbi:MAG: GNAT family N-acetyltransferase [Clostridiales bacterium]|nr:GNAT family N-acetyltransferase [Clostridiales bacterium]
MRKIELVPEDAMEEMRGYLNTYLIELSEFDDNINFDDNGVPIYRWFDFYWNDKGRYPFYFYIDEKIAGMSFVREVTEEKYEIAEFYMFPEFRGNGNAMWFAGEIANKFDGEIEFSTKHKNIRAIKFWTKFANTFDSVKASSDKEWQNWTIRKREVSNFVCGLQPKYFDMVKAGKKVLEGRLNDEKRRQMKIGDYIIFENVENREDRLRVKIVDKYLFDNFDQMTLFIDKEQLGFDKNDSDEKVIDVYRNIYSKEDEEKYGVLILKIEIA